MFGALEVTAGPVALGGCQFPVQNQPPTDNCQRVGNTIADSSARAKGDGECRAAALTRAGAIRQNQEISAARSSAGEAVEHLRMDGCRPKLYGSPIPARMGRPRVRATSWRRYWRAGFRCRCGCRPVARSTRCPRSALPGRTTSGPSFRCRGPGPACPVPSRT